jgi:hypothetical protein
MMLMSILQTLRTVVSLTLITALILLASECSAAAHAGHGHAETEGGLNLIPTLEVAGTVAVLGIAYLLGSRIYRYRDGSVTERSGENRDEE